MVRLAFNEPKRSDLIEKTVSGKSFKSVEQTEKNLSPFKSDDCIIETKNDEVKNELDIKGTKDLVGLEGILYLVREWYKKAINDHSAEILLLVGPVGCGKSELVKHFCLEDNIKLLNIDTNNLNSKSEFDNLLRGFCNFKEMFNIKKSKKLILIDHFINNNNDIVTISDIIHLFSMRSGIESNKLKKNLK